MRSALICVFIAIVVTRDGSCAENEDHFKPTPIPLSDWPSDKQEAAGTLQEIIKTDAPEPAVPAHYWEDALRHSVYLTLVRDKIDQLIAQGDYISPNKKPENQMAKDIDDHDLWERIKSARFERLKEEPIPPAEVVLLSKGRLIEDKDGYKFIEDNVLWKNCSDSDCSKDVKAYWSVKRMRQSDGRSGKYTYELTFSVTSQTNKKVKKPYENPVRTFTIKENAPTERPQARNQDMGGHRNVIRPQRAIWVHRNINPAIRRPQTYGRGLDRLFSSFFSDEDSYEDTSLYRHKTKSPKMYLPNLYPQHSKFGFLDEREQYHQKKLPYPLPYTRYTNPPPPVPYVQHPYTDTSVNLPYVSPHTDNRHVPSNIVKTTRPAVLPTPVTNYPLHKEPTIEFPVKTKFNATEYTTKVPDVVTTFKMYSNPKPSPVKISYVTDHVRPPVYSAPPGVFVTMDKKPFKPMPPLKYNHSNKPSKHTIPDFRPSPQVLDTQFSELDLSADSAFRPINMNFTDFEEYDVGKKSNKNIRKPNAAKKPPKKHEHIKPGRLTTVSPDIITAQSQSMEDTSLEWANILGAFTKTTPMASQREKGTKESSEAITTTTPLSTTLTEETSEEVEDSIEEVSPSTSTTSTTTTTTTTTTPAPKPKKRTRPPPKFNKQEKIKKHKRITTTTTTTTTTTPKPTRPFPIKKPSDDLTPQASSAATSGTNSIRDTKVHKAQSTTSTSSPTTTSTTPRTTTTAKLATTSVTTTSTTTSSSTAVDTEQPVVTTQPKSKNRFRQSTLMQKGTSVNHDKWSASTSLDKTRTNQSPLQNPARRKASKFQGYIPASTPRNLDVDKKEDDHKDYGFVNTKSLSETTSTTEHSEHDIEFKMKQTAQATYEEQDFTNDADDLENFTDQTEPTDDDDAFIFSPASITKEIKSVNNDDDDNNIEYPSTTTEYTVVASPHSVTKNKTKCKKKKHNNLTTTEAALQSSSETDVTNKPEKFTMTTTSSTTQKSAAQDMLTDLFGGFTMDDEIETQTESLTARQDEQKQSQSEKHEQFVSLDDDLEEFLYSLEDKHKDKNINIADEYEEEDDDEDSPFNNDEENVDSSKTSEDYYEEPREGKDRPFSLLELMAME
ncbi:mucin-5AC-like [Spodoptera frugiperda]|uniref:Mucin-5AC-like n=1 Tax=Spodoptera frugiperda TaxID=7108 RepID=A0A9R0DC27_SPOFR|nr:mucin-5AC-like [Spodoptera frugiperda]